MTESLADALPTLSPKAEEIVRRTTEFLAVGGYNGFSYADIAAVVGISKPSIHHHFPSKAALVQSVVARYRADAAQGMAALSAHVADPVARLEGYCGYWAECIASPQHPICICALMAGELAALPEEVAQEVRGHFADLTGWLRSVIEAGVAQGTMALADTAESEARTFMATVHGAMLAARAFGEPAMFSTIAATALHRLRCSTI
jgi:TetR/AcrR family transcriptional repressor of nem operon